MLLDALRKRQHGNDLPCLLDQQDEDESHNDDDEDDIDTIHVAEAPLSSHGRSLKLQRHMHTMEFHAVHITAGHPTEGCNQPCIG